MTSRAEQETIIHWDRVEPVAYLYTAHQAQANRWIRMGYPVEVFSRDQKGTPRGWTAKVPVEAIRFRKVHDGVVVKRRGHGQGRRFKAVEHDQLVAVET